MPELILVTGASGYLASHVVNILLEQGYRVRGTVRSVQNAKKVGPIKALDTKGNLELVEADLNEAATWPPVLAGVDAVIHVASPITWQSNEETIKTALAAVSEAKNVKKVVLTSSGLAIFDGQESQDRVYDERDWGISEKAISDYSRSKIIAEKAAWEFWNGLPKGCGRFGLTVINPAFIIGPPIIDDAGTSVGLITNILTNGNVPLPPHQIPAVDVRDAALAHVKALKASNVNGERILATQVPSLWVREMAQILSKEFVSQGYNVAAVDPSTTGKQLKLSNEKSIKLLGIKYRPSDKSLIEMVYGMIERGLAPKTPQYRGVPKGLSIA